MTFAEYYIELQKREGHEPLALVNLWPPVLIDEITKDLTAAIQSQTIKGADCPLREGSSNQSVGNQVEAFVMPKLMLGLKTFRLEKCKGAGYPDQILSKEGHKIAFEVKATGDWNPADSNRRVLTSSSEKLRKFFRSPIHHLLCTVLYQTISNATKIEAIRLDFLEPSSPVSVRLEVSVNHKLLATGSHHSVTI